MRKKIRFACEPLGDCWTHILVLFPHSNCVVGYVVVFHLRLLISLIAVRFAGGHWQVAGLLLASLVVLAFLLLVGVVVVGLASVGRGGRRGLGGRLLFLLRLGVGDLGGDLRWAGDRG